MHMLLNHHETCGWPCPSDIDGYDIHTSSYGFWLSLKSQRQLSLMKEHDSSLRPLLSTSKLYVGNGGREGVDNF
jgi:hypothetical protein